MTFVKLEDTWPDHPKIVGLDAESKVLYIEGLCYCALYLTDGRIKATAVVNMSHPDRADALVAAGLWYVDGDVGWEVHDYLKHQRSKAQVTAERTRGAARAKAHRTRKTGVEPLSTAVQPAEPRNTPVPRVHSAQAAVLRIATKLTEARQGGVNAWNLSQLVAHEWDTLHHADDLGGCIALTVWYVTEMQGNQPTTQEIARIGQMTRRFGRIALLAIDEATMKQPDDLVSYAFRVAQGMYDDQKGGGRP